MGKQLVGGPGPSSLDGGLQGTSSRVLDVFARLLLVDVFIDRVRALMKGTLEEQGVHRGDAEGKGGGSAA